MTYLLLIIGFALLIKGADFLVDGAASLARRLKVSDLAIGLTIVSFGTSAPELIINIFASLGGNIDIAIGNILGSNIANIFLILGAAAAIYPLAVTRGTVWKEIPFSLLAALVIGFMANDILIDKNFYSSLTRIDGLILLSFFVIFLYYTFGIAKVKGANDDSVQTKEYGTGKSLFFIIVGLAALILGGRLVVSGATELALLLGVSETLIGLTIVALGTSLPEFATSVVAAYKRNVDIAVGNVVGSNIFNIFFVLGVSAILNPLPLKTGYNFDLGAVILATLLLFIFMFIGKRHTLERWQGIMFVLMYVVYIALIVYRG